MPEPWRASRRFMRWSCLSAMRSVVRSTPRSVASWRSGGSRDPGGYSPRKMRARSASASTSGDPRFVVDRFTELDYPIQEAPMQALRYDLDTASMLQKCHRLQWSVHDIDWAAPGADVGPEQARALRAFMVDLYWIESAAAIVFRAMSEATPEQPLRDIYATFAVDEQRHADAELGLMRRWGIVAANEVPAPNTNARNLLTTIDRVAHRL